MKKRTPIKINYNTTTVHIYTRLYPSSLCKENVDGVCVDRRAPDSCAGVRQLLVIARRRAFHAPIKFEFKYRTFANAHIKTVIFFPPT